ncbi:MAG: hypothetical protein UZ15_CFX003000249 [Chloroflexi bacterium OLB15]|nr:MAG: hypothetical protein UZ15_CFX003000249 [Chloroflexi bacterium OLB15]
MKRGMIAVLAAIILGAMVVPFAVSAQDTEGVRSLTITEERINDSFIVTNPPARNVSNISVDLQAGQVILNFDWTSRRPRGQGATTVSISSVWTPSIENGRLFWVLQSATLNGEQASADLLRQINMQVSNAWRNYIRRQMGAGHVTNVTITENDITISWTPPMI